jgi:hypothetical protein
VELQKARVLSTLSKQFRINVEDLTAVILRILHETSIYLMMKPMSSFETSKTGYPAKQRDVQKNRTFSVEIKNRNRDSVAEVCCDIRYIWRGGAPMEHFMDNSGRPTEIL